MNLRHCLLIILAITAICASSAYPEPRELKFNPPAKVEFTVKSVTSRAQYLADELLAVDSTMRTSACVLDRINPGWTLTSTITEFSGKRDTIPLDDRMIKVMQGLKTTLTLDSVGEATEIEGFDQLIVRIDALKDSIAGQLMKEMLSPELMGSKEMDDWNLAMSQRVGRQFVIGSVKHESSDMKLPDDASLTLFELSFLLDTVRYEGRLYARVMWYTDTDPIRLAKTTNRSVTRMAEIFEMPAPELLRLSQSNSDYRATHELIFDVETLLPASEKIDREIMLLQTREPGKDTFSRQVETVEKSYAYTKR